MDRTIGPWDCLTIFWTSLLTISGGGGGGGLGNSFSTTD